MDLIWSVEVYVSDEKPQNMLVQMRNTLKIVSEKWGGGQRMVSNKFGCATHAAMQKESEELP